MAPVVLIVNQFDRFGGAARNAWDQYQGLKERGLPVYMAVDQKKSQEATIFTIPRLSAGKSTLARLFWKAGQIFGRYEGKIPIARRLRWIGETIAYPQAVIERRRGWEDFNFPGTELILDLPPARPDLVHLYNLHSGYFDLRVLPTLSQQVPTVMTLLDTWLLAGHCGYSLGCQRWMTGCGNCPHLSVYPGIRRDGSAFNWQRKKDLYARSRLYLAVPCQWMADKVEKSILKPAAQTVRIIPSGVDQKKFLPGDRAEARRFLGLAPDSRILLFVGQRTKLNPFKDVQTVEKAFEEVCRQPDRSNVLLLCLGKETSEEKSDHSNIRYLPFTQDDAVIARYYHAADILLHAAHEDTFPNVVLEALSCGLPVIASAVGGIPEQMIDGQTGFLVPQSSPEEMARRISHLLDDMDLCHKMGIHAAEYARERFNLDRSLSRYMDLYAQAIVDHGSRG